MKTRLSFLYILTITVLSIGCKPDAFKEIGNPSRPLESISGEWKLKSVKQSDLNAIDKGFPYKMLDITDVLPYQDVTLSLSFSSGAPGNFSTSNADGLDIFDFENGVWSVDDKNAPKLIYLINNNDTATLTLGEYPGVINNNQLVISIIRIEEMEDPAKNKNLIRYDYEFVH